jgi:anti-sigma regulatory factor (Ser/Thr protein kinase)
MDWLTVELVEELQNLIEAPQTIQQVVAGLKGASLPGLLEYGCLRWSQGDGRLPLLPQAIWESDIGRALNEVRSELGLRAVGPPKQALKRLDIQPVEFCTLHAETDMEASEWQEFVIRYERSTMGCGFSKAVAMKLHAALYELAENSIIHSAASTSALVGYRVLPGVSQFCIADVGIGVLESLRQCSDFSHLNTHIEGLRLALHDGVSRFGKGRGGLGFGHVFKSLAEQWGSLRFRSGEACITMDGNSLDADVGSEDFVPFRPGFQVTVCCRMAVTPPGGESLI